MSQIQHDLIDITLPCGSRAHFDQSSGIGYRCYECMAMFGSIGMPPRCKEEADKWDVQKALGGEGWDFFDGTEEEYAAD